MQIKFAALTSIKHQERYKMKLYHYTDAHGLMGIIRNQALWATDMRFLNDSKEMLAGIDLIERRCSEIIENISCSEDHIFKSTKKLYEFLPTFVRNNLSNRNTYIVSFSDADDNLRQWMAYCPKNSGYAIEFDSKKILIDGNIERANHVVCRLEKVDYDEIELDGIISPERIIEQLKTPNTDITKVALKTANDLIFHCCAIKSSEFYDERETRLIVQSQTEKTHPMSFRSRAGIIIPYFEYPVQHTWIKEITIGPNSNMLLARKGLEDFLHAHSISCNIRESKCSLRVF